MHKLLNKSLLTIFGGLALQSFATLSAVSATPAATAPAATGPTVVLVHGAWADGSGWDKVVSILLDGGLRVVSVQSPLSSLGDDVAATKRVLDSQPGPIILVGHSWGGVVISEAGGHEKVKSLVYVAAFAPSEGESVNDLLANKELPKPPGLASIRPDPSGYLWLAAEGIGTDFAQDLPPAQTRLMAVSQKPIFGASFGQKTTAAAWRSKNSWYLVAIQDRMIPALAQQALAKKIGARVTAVDSGHVPMMSKPQEVAAVIMDAVRQTTK